MKKPGKSEFRRLALHLFRVGVLALIVFLIHRKHQAFRSEDASGRAVAVTVAQVSEYFSSANAISISAPDANGLQTIHDISGDSQGYVVQTSPKSDHVIGYSGPNNVMIVFGPDDRIIGAELLHSGDTRDHAEQVENDEFFLQSFNGLTAGEAANVGDVDAVSGATLTSLAIAEGVIHRLGGTVKPGRFPDEIDAAKLTNVFPGAIGFSVSEADPRLLEAMGESGAPMGLVARTTPFADKVMGYQGPTDALIALEPDGSTIKGLALNESYDNQPYVRYVAEDDYFLNYFNGWTLAQLAETNLVNAEVEGVSGATMSSVGMAEGMQAAARELIKPPPLPATTNAGSWKPRGREIGTAVAVIAGLALGFSKLRSNKRLRIVYQVLLIAYLGFVNGDMVSQTLLVGWAQNGVAWRFASGLVLLTAAALILPVVTKRNIYCQQLCPFGAAQDLLKHRVPWRLKLSRKVRVCMELIPALLLVWVVVVAALNLPFNLAGIEPFDAFVWKVAGASAIAIAISGLIASIFLPMAYCRYGCPTGALLNFLRFNNRSDRFTPRDGLAVALAVLAAVI